MLDTSHALIGASLAKLIPNPYLGLPLSLISHVLADKIPHWDFNTRQVKRPKPALIILSLSDAFTGLLLGYFIFKSKVEPIYLFSMMLTAQLPDWLEGPYHLFNWRFFPFKQIKQFQSKHHYKLGLPWGLIIQILIVLSLTITTLQ